MENNPNLNLVIYDSYEVAADNGEYLYRRIRELYPSIKMTFLISRKGRDYNRLKEDGFNIKALEDGGLNGLMGKADFILFSKNIGGKCELTSIQSKYRWKTIFLAHGVSSQIYDDGFYFRNTIGNWAKYVLCTSQIEKNLLNRYSSGKFNVVLTGFPRHDVLLQKYRELDMSSKSKQIFISFHWRVGGNLDSSEYYFRKSQYLKDINALLNSPQLKEISDSGVKVCFLPHAKFMKYKRMFRVPKYVEVPLDKPFQDILVESDVLVTDFSSNSFEMAYMDKPSIIYVPGLKEVKVNHRHYHVDKLNYPHMRLCKNKEDVFEHIKEIVNSNGMEKPNIANQIFDYVDTDNTKRLVDWMLEHREEPLKNRTEDRLSRLKENARFWYG